VCVCVSHRFIVFHKNDIVCVLTALPDYPALPFYQNYPAARAQFYVRVFFCGPNIGCGSLGVRGTRNVDHGPSTGVLVE